MYVLLSNLYAASGRWVDADKMRSKMRDVGVLKVPGYSWVEVQNKIHTFSVGDCSHPNKENICLLRRARSKNEGGGIRFFNKTGSA
jgi:hypothetical protein